MSLQARVKLDPGKVIGSVDPRLFGANLEHFGETIYGGIWTEMVRSPKFSGPDPRLFEMATETGRNPNHGVVVPWEAVNPDHQRVIFEHDRTVFYSGAQSQRITIRQDDGKVHGIRQGGLHLEKGRDYKLRLTLRGKGQQVSVHLGDQTWHISGVASDWRTFHRVITPQHDDPHGELQITFQGEYSLWIGAVSLMPADEPFGYRPDLLKAMRPWSPTHLRWPGGNFASAYRWMDGVGQPDLRPAYLDPAFHLWESNLVGTDEFVAFCRLANTEPMITVNMGNGTPEEAAAWVEYCNGSADTKYGALRAQNGNPAPYQLKTWYVGNEQFGNWQVGHCDPETYAYRFLEFARAMRAVDPDLELIAVGVPGDQYSHWNERLLKIAGAEIDQLSLHYYSIRTWRWESPPAPEDLILPKLAAGHDVRVMLEATLEITGEFSDPPVPIAFDEWNTNTRGKPPLWIEDYNLADAIYTAGVMNACLQNADRVKLSAIYNLVNAMGCYRVSPSEVWKTPATLVMEMYAQNNGPVSLACQVDAPTFAVGEIGTQQAYEDVPILDAAATLDPDRALVFLAAANRSVDSPVEVHLDGLAAAGEAQMHLITAAHALVENLPASSEKIEISQTRIDLAENVFELPPLCIAVLVISSEA